MAEPADETYTAFEEKVKKSIYIHNLSPQVTKAVLENALNQFGNVKDVNFIPNYFTACGGHAALVQMESAKQAEEVIRDIAESPLMVTGMPRPVKAQKAEADMFEDRPKKNKKRIACRWMDPCHKNFEVAKRLKVQTKKHAAEIQFLMGVELTEDEKLHNQQSEMLKTNYKKYELIDGTHTDGNMKRLAAKYGTKINDY